MNSIMASVFSIRLDDEAINDLDLLVELEYGVNRSDVIRIAIRRFTDEILTTKKRRNAK